MKKIVFIAASLFLSITMQAQDRTQPKPGPAPKINVKKPVSFTLENGLKVLVVEDHKLPRVSFSLRLDNAPYTEGDKKGVADLTSALLGNGSLKTSKDAFNEEIDFLGADINFSTSGSYASGLSKYSKRILELFAEGNLQPNFTQGEFDKEKEKLIDGLKTQEKSVKAVAGRVENVLIYGKSNPAGEYLTEQTIKNVSLADVKQNYATYFVPGNAYLIVVGDVKLNDVKKEVTRLFSTWTKGIAPNQSYSTPSNPQYTQINFVDMPNAVQSEIAILNSVNLKLSDPDYFPVLVANQVLGGDFNGYLNMNLREKHGWTYGSYSDIEDNKYLAGKFKAEAQVRNSVTDSAVVEMLNEIKRIRTEKVSEETLNSVKAGYVGRFVMQVEKPQSVARYAYNIATEGLPANFYENYIKNIQAVTADDVMRVMNKYVLADNLRILVTSKGSEVLPGLEKLGIPVFYFDKFGNQTEKPALKKPVPAGITVKTITDNYAKAIGGEKAIKSVKSIVSLGSTKIPQAPAPLSYTSKIDNKGRMMIELSMSGMSIMKQVVNEKGGYMMQQGQKIAVEGKDLDKMKESAMLFSELSLPSKAGVTVTGIEPINGKDAYVVADGDSNYYFDTTTGLKVAESQVQEQGGKKMTTTTYINDYRDVKGVKVPFNIVMNVGFELDIKLSEVKINEGTTDADFQ
ncbi:putative Zn-dependent peptidase [Flavobacterium croceum DSM 17960]|uniref:Putative Zn-dependent peptidase n=1 Tax=Flavobacterium croceum DSM 17960 TaxID=1121886 RepID=A0A2S4NAG8_9FLAO|nr:pitrilysin family protein [Flavobacterium croceum]POS02680.1 putative Zn-dependent peptidase [Flavobacterium croceum DSM 17960]